MFHPPEEGKDSNGCSSVTAPRLILLTGAAGRIGTAFRLAQGHDYCFRLADLETASLANTPGAAHEIIRLDVADAAACRAACAGIDTVVHLAADPRPDAPWEKPLAPIDKVWTDDHASIMKYVRWEHMLRKPS